MNPLKPHRSRSGARAGRHWPRLSWPPWRLSPSPFVPLRATCRPCYTGSGSTRSQLPTTTDRRRRRDRIHPHESTAGDQHHLRLFGTQFVYDPQTDFEQFNSTLLNQLFTLQVDPATYTDPKRNRLPQTSRTTRPSSSSRTRSPVKGRSPSSSRARTNCTTTRESATGRCERTMLAVRPAVARGGSRGGKRRTPPASRMRSVTTWATSIPSALARLRSPTPPP